MQTRRRFLQNSTLMTGSFLFSQTLKAALGASVSTASLTADFSHPGFQIPADFLGFSFERNRVDGAYLAPSPSLVRLIDDLGATVVLRIGGNSSDWPSTTTLNPAFASVFAALVRQTGARVIWGLNLGSGTPAQAASDAQLIASLLGDRLIAFQVGNEPDAFNGRYRSGYDAAPYLNDFHTVRAAILAKVPNARFMGPDVSNNSSWLGRFAIGAPGQIIGLTHHYYGQQAGKPETHGTALTQLLNNAGPALDYRCGIIASQDGSKLPLRMTETNTCWGGGQAWVSDVEGATLWVINLAFTLAARGWSGLNLHSNDPSVYSPLLIGSDGQFHAQPPYYGLRFFSEFGFGQVCPVSLSGTPVTLRAFANRSHQGKNRVILINFSQTAPVTVALPQFAGHTVSSFTLTAAHTWDKVMTLNGVTVDEGGAAFRAPGKPMVLNAGSVTVPSGTALALITN